MQSRLKSNPIFILTKMDFLSSPFTINTIHDHRPLDMFFLSINLLACDCNEEGSEDLTCDAVTGKCHCKCDVEGDKCDGCTDGHKLFPDCHG